METDENKAKRVIAATSLTKCRTITLPAFFAAVIQLQGFLNLTCSLLSIKNKHGEAKRRLFMLSSAVSSACAAERGAFGKVVHGRGFVGKASRLADL